MAGGAMKKFRSATQRVRSEMNAETPRTPTDRSASELSNMGGMSGGKQVSAAAAHKMKQKMRERVHKKHAKNENLVTYDVEALRYIELLCQSQLFQTWFVRQQKDTLDPFTKQSGIQVYPPKILSLILLLKT